MKKRHKTRLVQAPRKQMMFAQINGFAQISGYGNASESSLNASRPDAKSAVQVCYGTTSPWTGIPTDQWREHGA